MNPFAGLFSKPTPAPAAKPKRPLKIPASAVVQASLKYREPTELDAFTVAPPMPGARPATRQKVDGQTLLAMDDMTGLGSQYAATVAYGYWKEGLGFLGFPYLAELSQRSEYRRPVEIIAKDMTRKGFRIIGGKDQKTPGKESRSALLADACRRFMVANYWRTAIMHDGFFGSGVIYPDTGDTDDDKELTRPLILDKRKIGKGDLKGFVNVEPFWIYPAAFNATDPLDPYFYKPQMWYVMAKAIHVSRLVRFVARELPDILKPAYAFSGLALTQLGKPYVDNYLNTRQGVQDLIISFNVPVLKTDMSALESPAQASGFWNRLDLFAKTRTNRGILALNSDEEFTQISASLAGLDKLQAQAQEHQAAAWGIPLVVLFGITPTGLNASSDGELKTYQGWIKSRQEDDKPQLMQMIRLVELNEFGDNDPTIDIEFVPLWEESDTEKATINKTKADTSVAYIQAGVIDPEEERERLQNDPDSIYAGVDLSGPPPEPPADPSQETDPDSEEDPGDTEGGAEDAAFREEDHPRAENGQFGSGPGGVEGAVAQQACDPRQALQRVGLRGAP